MPGPNSPKLSVKASANLPLARKARIASRISCAVAMASAGAATTLLTPAADAGPARRLAVTGAVVELAAGQVMERRLGELAEPYHQGAAGRYARLAKGCTAAGAAAIGLAGRRRRPLAVAGAGLLLAGSALERLAVYKAGFQSARDPKYVVKPQRARLEAANR